MDGLTVTNQRNRISLCNSLLKGKNYDVVVVESQSSAQKLRNVVGGARIDNKNDYAVCPCEIEYITTLQLELLTYFLTPFMLCVIILYKSSGDLQFKFYS